MREDVIDEFGQRWALNDPHLRLSLSTTLQGAGLKTYLTVNLGWISVRTLPNAFHVRIRPSSVSDEALATLLYQVHDRPGATVMLDIYCGAWRHFLMRDRRMFVQFLASIIAGERKTFWPGERLLNQWTFENSSPFSDKIKFARTLGSTTTSQSDLKCALDALFNGRWALHELDTERGHSLIEDIGSSYTPFNPKWLATARGQTICAYGDEPYGLWIASKQKTAYETATATFDNVDAIVAFPGIGDTRLRYSRLTLPLRRPDGRRLILSAAVSNSSIDLRQIVSKEAR